MPVRTLYEWKRMPIPESTLPHRERTRENRKQYDDQKKKFMSSARSSSRGVVKSSIPIWKDSDTRSIIQKSVA